MVPVGALRALRICTALLLEYNIISNSITCRLLWVGEQVVNTSGDMTLRCLLVVVVVVVARALTVGTCRAVAHLPWAPAGTRAPVVATCACTYRGHLQGCAHLPWAPAGPCAVAVGTCRDTCALAVSTCACTYRGHLEEHQQLERYGGEQVKDEHASDVVDGDLARVVDHLTALADERRPEVEYYV